MFKLFNSTFQNKNLFSFKRRYFAHPEAKITTLSNGVRVATEKIYNPAATVGVWLDSGSRDEDSLSNGAAHFLEHLTFKGTSKLSQSDFEKEVENLGATMKSTTSRENASFSAFVHANNAGKCLRLLSEALLSRNFCEETLEKERKVILRQLEEVQNNPEALVTDYLHSVAYQGTALSKSIYGSTANIESMQVVHLKSYIEQNYCGKNIVVCGVGDVDHAELVAISEEKFGHLKETSLPAVNDVVRYTGSEVRVRDDDLPYSYAAVAFEGVAAIHPDFFVVQVANQMMSSWNQAVTGGKFLSSPLARIMAKERPALSYKNFLVSYSDTGLFGCYFVAERDRVDDALFEIQSEWLRICVNCGDHEVQRAKLRLRNFLLDNLCCTNHVFNSLGRSLLAYGRRVSPMELIEQIERVTPERVKSVMTDILYDRCPAIAGYGAIEGLPDYMNVRGANHWFRL